MEEEEEKEQKKEEKQPQYILRALPVRANLWQTGSYDQSGTDPRTTSLAEGIGQPCPKHGHAPAPSPTAKAAYSRHLLREKNASPPISAITSQRPAQWPSPQPLQPVAQPARRSEKSSPRPLLSPKTTEPTLSLQGLCSVRTGTADPTTDDPCSPGRRSQTRWRCTLHSGKGTAQTVGLVRFCLLQGKGKESEQSTTRNTRPGWGTPG